MLLCKQNSHEISSSPIIWGSSLLLCANAKKIKKEGEGGVEGARKASCCWTIPCFHRISVTKSCYLPGSSANALWQVGSLVKRAAVAGSARGRELKDVTFNQKKQTSQKLHKRRLIENLHVWRQPRSTASPGCCSFAPTFLCHPL